ncbi:MAG: hypothetical protein AAFQ81_04000 [Pseudomonadota bacterium]
MTAQLPAQFSGYNESSYVIAGDKTLDSDALGQMGVITATGTITITIPANLGWKKYQVGLLFNEGGATATLAGASGVTLREIGNSLTVGGEGAFVHLMYLGNELYQVSGQMAAA